MPQLVEIGDLISYVIQNISVIYVNLINIFLLYIVDTMELRFNLLILEYEVFNGHYAIGDLRALSIITSNMGSFISKLL